MSDITPSAMLDFRTLPIAKACELLRRVALALVHDVLAQRPLAPISTLLRPGEERLLAPAARRDLRRHRRAEGVRPKRSLRLLAAQQPLRAIGQAWRRGEVSPRAGRVLALEQIESGYKGVTAERVPAQFWKVGGICAWHDLAFQYEVADAIRKALHNRVIFTSAEIKAIYPVNAAAVLLAPQTFWLLIAAADTCPPGMIWRPSARRLRRAAAHLQMIADDMASAEHWAGFWDQWLMLELARQDKNWFDNLTPQLQDAVAALPIFGAVPSLAPPPSSPTPTTPPLRLAARNVRTPPWLKRLYPQAEKQAEKVDTDDNQ